MMRRAVRSVGFFLLAAPLAAACDKPDSIVIVNVAADTDVGTVLQLRAQVSNAGDGSVRFFPATGALEPIAFETSFSLSVPRDRTGALDIALDGMDSGGGVVASGAGSVELRAGDNVSVTITLHAEPSLCGNNMLDAGEACDDGDRLSTGACDYLCQPRTTGPGTGGTTGAGGAAGTGAAGTSGAAGMGGRGGAAGTSAAAGTGGTTGAGGRGGTTGAGGRGGAAGTGAGGIGGQCRVELLTSGGFDAPNNTRWTSITNGRILIWDQSVAPSFVPAPQSPTRLAWLGYDAHSMEPALRQNIQIPAGALQLNFSGYRQIQTDEAGCECDLAFVELDVGGTITELARWSAQNANSQWAFFSTFINATPVAGQTITFQLRVKMDEGVNTSFYFDTLSVTADLCP